MTRAFRVTQAAVDGAGVSKEAGSITGRRNKFADMLAWSGLR